MRPSIERAMVVVPDPDATQRAVQAAAAAHLGPHVRSREQLMNRMTTIIASFLLAVGIAIASAAPAAKSARILWMPTTPPVGEKGSNRSRCRRPDASFGPERRPSSEGHLEQALYRATFHDRARRRPRYARRRLRGSDSGFGSLGQTNLDLSNFDGMCGKEGLNGRSKNCFWGSAPPVDESWSPSRDGHGWSVIGPRRVESR